MLGTSVERTTGGETAGQEPAVGYRLPRLDVPVAALVLALGALVAVGALAWLLVTTPLGIVAVYTVVVLLPLLIPMAVVWVVSSVLERY
ncbi:hypothetical protein [Halomarina oriensis]|uniref:Uncharacterized protein n=1 Tax=Halomarina oriensis TaxID=671145 RepID=A0A6B0GKE5_9EURY|nr:hypothetical protein [Halomarina oriensis]MWG34277.1 hypothetical protein [Halomarina oriensis]